MAEHEGNDSGMKTYTRSGDGEVEKAFEKPVVLRTEEDKDPAKHAWGTPRRDRRL